LLSSSSVFWKKSLLNLISWDTFWLSATPFDVGTKAPEAGNPRICEGENIVTLSLDSFELTLNIGTTARFQAQSGIVTVMVTHWDDQSDEAREIGASLILHRANYEALTTKRVSCVLSYQTHNLKVFISPFFSLGTSIL